MNITVQRLPSLGGATLGKLFIDGVYTCWTLEDEIREVPGQPVAEWKIKGATAIPAGRYRVTLEHSGRFGPNTLTINDVPGFTHIRMHAGNTAANTEGCPLLGFFVSGNSIMGGTSGPAVDMVKKRVMEAIYSGREVWIDINNPVAQA